METKTFYIVNIIDFMPHIIHVNTEAQFYVDISFIFTYKTCLHQTSKYLNNALFTAPNLCLHQIQKKTVGGRQHWMFTWSENRGSFFQAV